MAAASAGVDCELHDTFNNDVRLSCDRSMLMAPVPGNDQKGPQPAVTMMSPAIHPAGRARKGMTVTRNPTTR